MKTIKDILNGEKSEEFEITLDTVIKFLKHDYQNGPKLVERELTYEEAENFDQNSPYGHLGYEDSEGDFMVDYAQVTFGIQQHLEPKSMVERYVTQMIYDWSHEEGFDNFEFCMGEDFENRIITVVIYEDDELATTLKEFTINISPEINQYREWCKDNAEVKVKDIQDYYTHPLTYTFSYEVYLHELGRGPKPKPLMERMEAYRNKTK